jgi:hypothetical protein
MIKRIIIAVLFLGGYCRGGEATNEVVEAIEKDWAFSAALSTFFVNGGKDYVQPTVSADYKNLHVEARYNYEALSTASVWLGYNFSFGKELTLDVAPMIGGAFGHTYGVAPGYKIVLGYWKCELYTEGEYLFDTGNSDDSFFYSWSELTISPADWIRVGIVAQRTRVRNQPREIQLGPLVGLSYKRWTLNAYVLDPGSESWTFMFSVGWSH